MCRPETSDAGQMMDQMRPGKPVEGLWRVIDALKDAELDVLPNSTLTIRIDNDGNVQQVIQERSAYVRRKPCAGA